MQYANSQMKVDQLIGYFNAKKINLIPPFQRGHVWDLSHRRKLLENMIAGRPIPAIFLYKEAAGSQFSYNILDGKQRLESLILFIGNHHPDLQVEGVVDYFFEPKEKKQVNFEVTVPDTKKRVPFSSLDDEIVRAFREYAIPTIEIDLDDETSLDEIINLFVDINQYGEKVKRFDIVKAIGQGNPLLSDIFNLVAQQQKRKNDNFYKKKNTIYTKVLQHLQTVEGASDRNQKVDRIWERLVEIVLYNRTNAHRQPGQILKAFIKTQKDHESNSITLEEMSRLKKVFGFLSKAYSDTNLSQTKLATDLPHFYTMVTTLLSSNLLDASAAPPAYSDIRQKLVAFAKLLERGVDKAPEHLREDLAEYMQAAARQTTHPRSRKTREQKLLAILAQL